MKLDEALDLEDLRELERRRLPRMLCDFIDGGVDDEQGLARNRAQFERHQLLPRYLVDVSSCDPSVELLGHTLGPQYLGASATGGGYVAIRSLPPRYPTFPPN